MKRSGIHSWVLGFFFIFSAFLLFPGQAYSDNELIIPTQYGPVQGMTVDDGEINGLHIVSEQWRGIPYASPPTQDRRWKDPQDPEPWIDPLDATQFASPCLQGGPGEGWFYGDEDCLYLNVFRPADYNYENDPPLPVLVHIHGGGNAFGAAEELVNPWLNQGLMVVTMNYRLGVWGFLSHPLLTEENGGAGSGNWALMDQMAALKWVQNNIEAFGGDKNNVTLSGFSAGTQDAQVIMASSLSQGLFERVATQTTANWSVYSGPWNTLEEYERIGGIIFERAGCDQMADSLECMRLLDPIEVLYYANLNGAWSPSASIDGRVLSKSMLESLKDSGNKVPLLLGSNREESTPFFLWDILDFFGGELSSGNYTLWSNDYIGPKLGHVARNLYTPKDYGSHTWAFLYLTTDMGFTCPVRDVARVNASEQPTYRYLFTHVLIHDELEAFFRSYHGVENFLLWNFYDADWYPYDEGEKLLSERMSRYWSNFAKTGNPNDDGNPHTSEADLPEWPLYTTQTENMIVLDTDISTLSGGYKNKECDALGGEVIFPKCTSLCRRFLQSVLHLPGWFVKKENF